MTTIHIPYILKLYYTDYHKNADCLHYATFKNHISTVEETGHILESDVKEMIAVFYIEKLCYCFFLYTTTDGRRIDYDKCWNHIEYNAWSDSDYEMLQSYSCSRKEIIILSTIYRNTNTELLETLRKDGYKDGKTDKHYEQVG